MNIVKLSSDILRGPSAFIKTLGLSDGVWLCGGAVRDCLLDAKPNDWDIFGVDKESLDRYEKLLKSFGFKNTSDNENLKTYIGKDVKIQLIHIYYNTPEDYIQNCDFTLCQFVYDGTNVICNPEAIIHIFNKKLVINKLQDKYIFDSIRRLQKYIKYGYTICNGGIKTLVEAIREAKQDAIDMSFEFYPNTNTPRFMRFD